MSSSASKKPRIVKEGSKLKLSHMEYYAPDSNYKELEVFKSAAKEVKEDINYNSDNKLFLLLSEIEDAIRK
jgi:hypothetical protein